jgi:hypothetical protein
MIVGHGTLWSALFTATDVAYRWGRPREISCIEGAERAVAELPEYIAKIDTALVNIQRL